MVHILIQWDNYFSHTLGCLNIAYGSNIALHLHGMDCLGCKAWLLGLEELRYFPERWHEILASYHFHQSQR